MCGETVNVVNRMESLGDAGKIQVSDEVCERLMENFVPEPRGIISVKGQSEMQIWWLTDRI